MVYNINVFNQLLIYNMKKVLLFIALSGIISLSSCTENQRARTFGGDMTIRLKAGEKLMMATWKGEDLFYLTEPMEEGYVPKVKFFYENSSYGVLETTVKFVESR